MASGPLPLAGAARGVRADRTAREGAGGAVATTMGD
jgi:hypothetical protein